MINFNFYIFVENGNGSPVAFLSKKLCAAGWRKFEFHGDDFVGGLSQDLS